MATRGKERQSCDEKCREGEERKGGRNENERRGDEKREEAVINGETGRMTKRRGKAGEERKREGRVTKRRDEMRKTKRSGEASKGGKR